MLDAVAAQAAQLLRSLGVTEEKLESAIRTELERQPAVKASFQRIVGSDMSGFKPAGTINGQEIFTRA